MNNLTKEQAQDILRRMKENDEGICRSEPFQEWKYIQVEMTGYAGPNSWFTCKKGNGDPHRFCSIEDATTWILHQNDNRKNFRYRIVQVEHKETYIYFEQMPDEN